MFPGTWLGLAVLSMQVKPLTSNLSPKLGGVLILVVGNFGSGHYGKMNFFIENRPINIVFW